MKYTKLGKAREKIDEQLLEGKRQGRASIEVRGQRIEIWGYRAVLRRGDKSRLYTRYIYVIGDTRIPASVARSLLKQEHDHVQ